MSLSGYEGPPHPHGWLDVWLLLFSSKFQEAGILLGAAGGVAVVGERGWVQARLEGPDCAVNYVGLRRTCRGRGNDGLEGWEAARGGR